MIRLKEITIINAPIQRCYGRLLTSEYTAMQSMVACTSMTPDRDARPSPAS
jgi:hypothetical protein